MFISGTQHLTLQDAESQKTHVWSSTRKGAISAVACAFICVPQQAYADPPSRFFTDIRVGARPSESTWVSGAPQLADLTLQGDFQQSLRKGDRPSESTFASGAPQLADFTLQGTFQKSLVKQGPVVSAKSVFGLHASVFLDAEGPKSSFFPSASSPAKPHPAFISAAPQADPSQISAALSPLAVSAVSGVIASEYSWGGHAAALANAEAAKTKLFPSAIAPPIPKILGAFVAGSSQLADLTLQPWWQESLVAGARPTASPTIIGGPLPVDLTLQATLSEPAIPPTGSVAGAQYQWGGHAQALDAAEALKSRFFATSRAPVVASPVARFITAATQALDATQQALIRAPTLLPLAQGILPPFTIGTPQADPSQLAAQVWDPLAVAHITGGVAATEYVWGAHALELASAEVAKTKVFQSATAPLLVGQIAKFITIPPQADLTQPQGEFSVTGLPQATVSPFMAGVSETVDVVQQASFGIPIMPPQVGPVPVFAFAWDLQVARLAAAESIKSQFFPAIAIGVVAPPPPVSAAQPSTIGGIERWTIQIPQFAKKKKYDFKRNMENQDRQDLEDIIALIKAWLDKDQG